MFNNIGMADQTPRSTQRRGLRHRRSLKILALGSVLALLGISVSHAADPSPSPLFKQSLEESVARLANGPSAPQDSVIRAAGTEADTLTAPLIEDSTQIEGFPTFSTTCVGASCSPLPTCEDGITCSATCTGHATCFPDITCQSGPTCGDFPTCFATCTGHATCVPDITCAGGITCGATCIGTTCFPDPTCEGGITCFGFITCGSTCLDAPTCMVYSTCAGHPTCYATCSDPTCLSETCEWSLTCGWSGYTCGGPTCDFSPTCNLSETCMLRPTCDGFPTCNGFPTCGGTETCPEHPTCEGYHTCILTCASVICYPTFYGEPTCAGVETCRHAPTCMMTCGDGATCTDTPTCPPWVATCAVGETCAGMVTCEGSVTCPGEPTCGGEITCDGDITCPPLATCGGEVTCDGTPTCTLSPTCRAGGLTCADATCEGGETCDGAATCAGSPTCLGTPTCVVTCTGTVTCTTSPTCPPWEVTCDGGATCPGTATCATTCQGPTCDASPTCAGTVTCMATCPGTPTCAGTATCPGSPTCQDDPFCTTVGVWIDILPQMCPNVVGATATQLPLPDPGTAGNNRGTPSVAAAGTQMPVAVLGGPALDVTDLDPYSFALNGVAPAWHEFADVSSPPPLRETPCECELMLPDGYTDLVLWFSTEAVTQAVGPPPDGDNVLLSLVGQTLGGETAVGFDCLEFGPQIITPLVIEPESAAVTVASYPNPFNAATVIHYTLEQNTPVTLEVYNILGQRIATLVSRAQSAGEHQVTWPGTDGRGRPVASGTYLYRLVTDYAVRSGKMTLLK